ncbi:hypothetical protein QYF36_008143 [Acer negundo]|nr:hypothetical protein QYF36_008143 [Acer negundo]
MTYVPRNEKIDLHDPRTFRAHVPKTTRKEKIVSKWIRKNENVCHVAQIALKANYSNFWNLWAEAVNTACYIGNRVFLRPGTRQISYELWRGRKPNVSYFHTFGSKCYILNDRDQLGKFNAKSDEGIFIGCALNSRAYRVFNLKTHTVMESSNVVVDDTRLKSNNHEEEVAIVDDSPLENVVETPNVEETQTIDRVHLLNSKEPASWVRKLYDKECREK